MILENADVIGVGLLVMLALLSGYFLVLRIKEYFEEKPDPKITYATNLELEKLRRQLEQYQRDNKADLKMLDERRSRSVAALHELVRKNAEHISALIARDEMFNQRLTEMVTRFNRYFERTRT